MMMMGRLGWWYNHELTVHGAIFSSLSSVSFSFDVSIRLPSLFYARALFHFHLINGSTHGVSWVQAQNKPSFHLGYIYGVVMSLLLFKSHAHQRAGDHFRHQCKTYALTMTWEKWKREICVDEWRRKSREFGSSQQRLWSIETKEEEKRSEKRREFNEWSEMICDCELEKSKTHREILFFLALLCCYYSTRVSTCLLWNFIICLILWP